MVIDIWLAVGDDGGRCHCVCCDDGCRCIICGDMHVCDSHEYWGNWINVVMVLLPVYIVMVMPDVDCGLCM